MHLTGFDERVRIYFLIFFCKTNFLIECVSGEKCDFQYYFLSLHYTSAPVNSQYLKGLLGI